MIPLHVKCHRPSARARLCRAWIIVNCDLLTAVARRQRAMCLKSADWLEATVESTILQFGNSDQQDKARATVEAYRDLQEEVESYAGGKHMREDVESLKVKFAALLDLCDIKDADIPLFDEPPVCTRQSLITSFGTMSKKSPRSAPKLSEPILRDPAVYGDLLLNYLLAQTDSDTSIHPDDSVTSDTGTEAGVPNKQVNSLDSPMQHSLLSQTVLDGLTPKCDTGGNEHQSSLFPAAGTYEGIRTPSHCTTDSGVARSDHSNVAAGCYSQQVAEAQLPEPQLHNRTSGSTPELPASQSSTCLDIMFASMFDSMESPDSVDLPITGDSAPVHGQSSGHFQITPVKPEIQDFSHEGKYTTTPTPVKETISNLPGHVTCEESSAAEIPCVTLLTPKHCHMTSQTSVSDQENFIFCEPLVVRLPPEPTYKSVVDKHNLNMDKQRKKDWKPHQVSQHPDVEQYMESERPPLPPRIPMTDTKRSSKNQAVCAEVCSPGRRGIKAYYSEKKVRRFFQQKASDLQQHACSKSKQRVQCEQCEREHKLLLRNGSAQSKNSHQDFPEANMVGSPKHYEKKSRKPQSRMPQASLTRSGSASKRRRGNDNLPVQNNQEDRLVSSARQRLKFVSPTRSREDETSSDSCNRQAFPVISPLKCVTDQAGHPKKVQTNVCRILKNHEDHKLQSPQQFSRQSPRKPTRGQYKMQVVESTTLTASNKCPASNARSETFSETSSIVSLPSREEELLDRQAYYRDFINRNVENCSSSRSVSSSSKDNGSRHSLDLVRTVEGSDSPSNVPFKVPPSGMRAPRAADQCHRLTRSKVSSRGVSAGPGCSKVLPGGHVEGSSSSKMTFRSDSSSQDYPSSSDSPIQTRSSLSSRSSSRSSRASSHKSPVYRSHPIASSTLILDSSYNSPVRDMQASLDLSTMAGTDYSTLASPDRFHKFSPVKSAMASPEKFQDFNPDKCSTIISLDAGSVISWTINEEFSDFLDNSFNHSPSAESSRRYSKRQSLHMDRDSTMTQDETVLKKPLTSTAISLSRLTDNSSFVSPPVAATAQAAKVRLNSTTDKHILSASNSFLQAVNSATTQKCSRSNNQAVASMRRYNAKASIVCPLSKENDMPENIQLPHLKHISASEPDLRNPCSEEADNSFTPTDADSTSDSLPWENKPVRARRPSTSSSSSCTAARCRPVLLTVQVSAVAPNASSLPDEYSSLPDEDLIDSILTDSPRSVNSSGIYAPHNSYTSPVRSADSHTGYSSSSASGEGNQTLCHEYPILPPPTPYNKPLRETSSRAGTPNKTVVERDSSARTDPPSTPYKKSERCTPAKADPSSENREHAHPSNPLAHPSNPLAHPSNPLAHPSNPLAHPSNPLAHPSNPLAHVNQTPTRHTRNQGVTADAPSTPYQPQIVIEASHKVCPSVPPPVVNPAPPKIKDKNSLVRKLKQFSTHFTRRTEKLQTLANL